MTGKKRTAHILLVDDCLGDTLLLKEAFALCDMEIHITVVDNGEKALQVLKGEEEYFGHVLPDLALFDVNIPKISGIELLRIIKQDDKLRHIPIIMLTSSNSERDIKDSYDGHANAFIVKPGNMEEFITIAHSIVDFWFSSVQLSQ